MELETDTFDVVVIGTGLAESIAAAALAKAGKTVLHLDPNEYYGGEQASLTLDELSSWARQRSTSPSNEASSSQSPYRRAQSARYAAEPFDVPSELERDQRRYALSLFPAVLPSRGPLISTLIDSDVSKYVSFRLLDSVSIWDSAAGDGGGLQRVPGSKEDVFKDKSVGLVDKRRMMKFLMWATGDFERDELLLGKETMPLPQFLEQCFHLPPRLSQAITLAIAHCSSLADPALPALKRTRRYLQSIGRYGTGAFLVGQYGGAGEIAQGFCRACAVHGGTYVLGAAGEPESIGWVDGGVRLKLPCHPTPITAKHLISAADYLPRGSSSGGRSEDNSGRTLHAVVVLPSMPPLLQKRPAPEAEVATSEDEEKAQDDTAVIIFPPAAGLPLIRAFITGDGSGSCPSGQAIAYLSAQLSASTASSSPQTILQPIIDRLHPSPLSVSFYAQAGTCAPQSAGTLREGTKGALIQLLPYQGSEILTEGLDWEAEQGEAAFWAVMGDKETVPEGEGKRFFEKKAEEGDEEEDL